MKRPRGPIETPPSVQNPPRCPVKVTKGHIPGGKSKKGDTEEEEEEGVKITVRNVNLRGSSVTTQLRAL